MPGEFAPQNVKVGGQSNNHAHHKHNAHANGKGNTMSNDNNDDNNNVNGNLNDAQTIIAQATTTYEYAVRQGHMSLVGGALDLAFQRYTNAVGYAWCITLLLSDDDTMRLEFWRNELSNVQQLVTALAVVLKARNMTLPVW